MQNFESLKKQLAKSGLKLIHDTAFEIKGKTINILRSEKKVFAFAYKQGEDDSIIFQTLNQVKKHFA